MTRNWFKKEAIYMQIPFISVLIIAGILTFIGPYYLNHFYSSTNNEEKVETNYNQGFYTGFSFGSISSNELQILKIWHELKYHECNDEKSNKNKCWGKDFKISDLNSKLISIYIYKNDIPEDFKIPENVRKHEISSSENKKKLYLRLKKERIQNGWVDKDPEQEKVINEILDLYVEYGNPFKIK